MAIVGSVPFDFTAATTAVSSQVNDNFGYIEGGSLAQARSPEVIFMKQSLKNSPVGSNTTHFGLVFDISSPFTPWRHTAAANTAGSYFEVGFKGEVTESAGMDAFVYFATEGGATGSLAYDNVDPATDSNLNSLDGVGFLAPDLTGSTVFEFRGRKAGNTTVAFRLGYIKSV